MQGIHPRLLQDCHILGTCRTGTILLHRNAVVPWLLLVPDTDASELCMLADTVYHQLMAEVRKKACFVKMHFRCERTNIASIGNVVEQIHIHVVGRSRGDACWPLPVWGHLPDTAAYTTRQVQATRTALLHNDILLSGLPA